MISIIVKEVMSSLPARQITFDSINENTKWILNNNDNIQYGITTLKQSCPWGGWIFKIENQLYNNTNKKLAYIIYLDKSWRVRGVPIAEGSFELRKGIYKYFYIISFYICDDIYIYIYIYNHY